MVPLPEYRAPSISSMGSDLPHFPVHLSKSVSWQPLLRTREVKQMGFLVFPHLAKTTHSFAVRAKDEL
jgi:hypothetical protein